MQVVRFEEFVEKANRARTTQELVAAFLATGKQSATITRKVTARKTPKIEPPDDDIESYLGVG